MMLFLQIALKKTIYKECVIPSPGWMTTKDFLLDLGAFNKEVYPEDYDLCFNLFYNATKIIGLKSLVLYWRDHHGRNSRNDDKYADQTFFHLKLDYFTQYEISSQSNLILYGAGPKGKKLAKELMIRNIKFTWFDGNEKRWGKDIYGLKIQSIHELWKFNNPQIIVSLSKDQDYVDFINLIGDKSSKEILIYRFC